MANAGDESILIGISTSVGLGMEAALRFAALWEGADPDQVSVVMNTDFIDTKLAPDEILALFEVYQGDGITLDEFLAQMKVGERLQGEPAEIARQAVAQAQEKARQAVELAQQTGGQQDAAGTRTPTRAAESSPA